MVNEIYLDNAATTPVHPGVAKAVMDCMMYTYGNPSSLHRLGLNAEKKIKAAREQLAFALGDSPDSIFFTSGGTEANNLAIIGTAMARKREGKHCKPLRLNILQY